MPKRTILNQDLKADYGLKPSSLEDIDYALYKYLDETLNISCDTNTGFQKVPIIFSIPERAFQIKNNPDLRPDGRMLEYPLISMGRREVIKNPQNKGRYGVFIPPYFDFYKRGGAIPIARQVQQDKTRNFAVVGNIREAEYTGGKAQRHKPRINKRIVIQSLSIPIPIYVNVEYKIMIKTEYQSQMNSLLACNPNTSH